MTARSLLSLLFNASKGLDVVTTALDLGILQALDAGPVTLREVCARTGAKPNRMYKFLDCLESMGLVERRQTSDERLDASYRSSEPLTEAASAVLGPTSIERDRDRYDWRAIHGQLPAVLRAERSIDSFDWPPKTPEQVRSFEGSMAAGCAPILESFLAAHAQIFEADRPCRWLDVGGGDGTLALGVLDAVAGVTADVFNLPSTGDLVAERARASPHAARLRLVPGDFFADELPGGYDVVSFVRVLHDWDERAARELLAKGARALAPGGTLVLCEEFRTRERLAVQFFWTYFLMGVDACESRLRDVDFYLRELSALGFAKTTVVPGSFDLVVARHGSPAPSRPDR
ncbi:MAG: Hydroxyneurosporene methyltransferase [Labilithrix sp.]|nr:Hydroxyneurosporene methyltransferase [Labilithrix sp.]